MTEKQIQVMKSWINNSKSMSISLALRCERFTSKGSVSALPHLAMNKRVFERVRESIEEDLKVSTQAV